jgi:hypothetical protein
MPDSADIVALLPVVEALQSLGVEFHVGGSVASNVYGVWRSTMDTDLVADLRREHLAPLVAKLSADYYIDAAIIQDAIAQRSSFNVIHFDTAQKIDVFIAKRRPFDESARARVATHSVSEDGRVRLPIASPEDIILNKLEWYRMGGEVSERQWSDVIGVMKVQAAQLDRPYLAQWARELGVHDLLERAWGEVQAFGG